MGSHDQFAVHVRDLLDVMDDVSASLLAGVRARAAKELGIGSQLGFQFHAEPHARGGVNLYSTKAHELTLESRQLGAMFANLVAVALGWSREHASLNEALSTRSEGGQAIGIVMERYRLDPDRAFAFLVRTS